MKRVLAALLNATVASATTLYLTTASNQLIQIDSATPGTIVSTVALTGFQVGDSAVRGIDFRPATNQMYLLSNTSLYTVNLATGGLTPVGATGQLSLTGTAFGFDFNPTVDRIRVVSDAGANLRLNPNTGGLAATDTALNGGAASAVAAAYTNNVFNAVTTTLYAISGGNLFTQIPPNAGTLNPVGALGVAGLLGFDILPDGTAFGVTSSNLYSINLATGLATNVGVIGSGTLGITGLASPTPTPEPGTILLSLLGLGTVITCRYRRG